MDTAIEVKDILMQTIVESTGGELDFDWYDNEIDPSEFDSITMVSFMVAIEDFFQIYIDEKSMETIDFMGTYQKLIDGIVDVVEGSKDRECIENESILTSY